MILTAEVLAANVKLNPEFFTTVSVPWDVHGDAITWTTLEEARRACKLLGIDAVQHKGNTDYRIIRAYIPQINNSVGWDCVHVVNGYAAILIYTALGTSRVYKHLSQTQPTSEEK